MLAAKSIAPTGLLSDKPHEDETGPVLHRDALAAAKLPSFDDHDRRAESPGEAEPVASPPAAVDEPSEREALRDEWFLGIDGAAVGPMDLEGFRSRVTDSHVTAQTLAWKDGMSAWAPICDVPDLLTEMQKAMSFTMMPGPLMPSGIPSLPPNALAGEGVPAALASVAPASYELPRRGGVSPAAWFAVVAAFVLGATVTYVFLPPRVKEVVKLVEAAPQVPVDRVFPPPPPPPAEEASPAAEMQAPPRQPSGSDDAVASRKASPTTARAASPTTAPPASSGEPRREGLLAGVELHGAAAPGPARVEPEETRSTASLDSVAVGRTVSRYSPAVRRSCWQPALNSRAAGAASSARVMVTINVEPSGRVQSVRTSGDPAGYAGLARCIEGKVRSWHFPRADGPTIANVPFVFAAQ